jgi:NADH-quinone oxidoreductase subunit L
VDEIYNAIAVQPVLRTCRLSSGFDLAVIDGMVNGTRHFTVGTAYVSAKNDDRVVDGLVNLVGKVVGWGSAGFRRAQTGRLENYALIFILGVFLMVCFLLFR